ncbi:RNA polymerase sigma factor [Salimicrobium salexigens]|uniref:RNA polymerase sigma-70 factor, ECF subfamily n=1 Tax=Salimicrobium salexigens TaxID=908941 RepID=A0ABY1KSM5_9BACI|nr:RNA polymerase sigma factor [Salimicrobium salexigens]SIS72069.1 RNA polymerase sigma-70 factor, ECF subfamily [Salimicrobium salexigens]
MTGLEEIYKRYFKDVYLFVYSLSKNRHIAEDITSETFLKAIDALDSFEGKSDIKVWLFQIAKNSYYSYLRKNKHVVNRQEIPEETDDTSIEKKVLDKEESMRIHKIIHDLPNIYKKVVTMRMFGELSYKEIGEIFGKTDNWACVTFYRARKKINEKMRE